MFQKNKNFFDYIFIQFGIAKREHDFPTVINVLFPMVFNDAVLARVSNNVRKGDAVLYYNEKIFVLTQLTDISQSKIIINRLHTKFPEIVSGLVVPMNCVIDKKDIDDVFKDLASLESTEHLIEIFDWKDKKRNNWEDRIDIRHSVCNGTTKY